MTGFSTAALEATLSAALPQGASGSVCVAFSGGTDSTVLLSALVELRNAGWPHRVRAIHVDHQLHPDSASWRTRSESFASRLGVPIDCAIVTLPPASGQGLEAAARTARYAALLARLEAGETLLTAHHADDQLETVLLALMRGAGVRGLAGMPRCRRVGHAWHVRPLLEHRRSDLLAWGSARGLDWIEDPANRDDRHRRSLLRQTVVPVLQRAWPEAAVVASRAAGHLAEAAALLDDLARIDAGGARIGRCLAVGALIALPAPRRRNLLRFWLRDLGLPMPSTRKLAVLENDMQVAGADRRLCVDWAGGEVRLHGGLLYAGPPLPGAPLPLPAVWDWREPLRLPEGLGELRAEPVTGRGIAEAHLPRQLTVHWRATLAGDSSVITPHRLKKLLQQADVLPWWRDRMPIISVPRGVVALGDVWHVRELSAAPDEAGVCFRWVQRPPVLRQRRSGG